MTCLTIVPCSDFEHDTSHNDSTVESHHSHEHSGDCEDDGCSPFCICSCCHTNFVLTLKYSLKTQELRSYSLEKRDNYSDMLSSPYHEVLFHPPIG